MAYKAMINRIEEQWGEPGLEFGIAMIDLNYLKQINDTYGHEAGNTVLKNLSRIICDIFNKTGGARS